MLSKEVEVSWYYKTRKHYEDLGYIYTKQYDKFTVPIEHLHEGSATLVEVQCDYCGKVFTRRYCDHTYIINKEIVNKDACKDCGRNKSKDGLIEKYGVNSPFESEYIRNKAKDTFMERYGVDNPFEIPEVIEQIKQTNLEKYGVEYYTQTDEYKERVVETNIQKYGVDNPSKNDDIKRKIKNVQIEKYGRWYSQTNEYKQKYKQTCLDRYGVENSFQSEDVKDKIIDFNMNKYGVPHPMMDKNIARKRIKKMVITKYKNGSGVSSRQQDYIAKLVKGDINYPVDGLSLDIRINQNTFIEYDGSGHDLRVQHNEMTREEFDLKEIKRKYFLISQGWREIRIISTKDLLPSDNVLLELIHNSLDYLNEGHSWIKIDIDSNKLICSQYEKDYNFGELRKITEKDLN